MDASVCTVAMDVVMCSVKWFLRLASNLLGREASPVLAYCCVEF